MIDKYLEPKGECAANSSWYAWNGPQEFGLEEMEIRGRINTIQTTALWSARKLRKVQEAWGDLLSLKLQWKTEKSRNNKQL